MSKSEEIDVWEEVIVIGESFAAFVAGLNFGVFIRGLIRGLRSPDAIHGLSSIFAGLACMYVRIGREADIFSLGLPYYSWIVGLANGIVWSCMPERNFVQNRLNEANQRREETELNTPLTPENTERRNNTDMMR